MLDCLAKDPDARPGSAAQVQERIALLGAGLKWSPADARSWWQRHLPELAAGDGVAERLTVTR